MKGLKQNKKGSIIDIVFIGVVLLVFACSVLLSYKIVDSFSDQVQSMSVNESAKNSVSRMSGYYGGVIDNSFLLLTIGLAIGAFILASLVRVHPIFIPMYIIALVMVILFAGIFSNIYQGMAESTALADQANDLIFISNILEFLPFIVGVFGTILAIVMYKLYQTSA